MSNMVIFLILLLNDKRVISQERNTVRASKLLTWTDNTSKVGYDKIRLDHDLFRHFFSKLREKR